MVSVLITAYNSGRFLGRCLQALRQQTYNHVEIIAVDNASTDTTRPLLQTLCNDLVVILNNSNVGFAAAQNQAARVAKGTWLLSLNPDVVLTSNFISLLVAAGEANPGVGTVCGKLLRWNAAQKPEFTHLIDSTGIYFTPDLRHLDRGADQEDRGQYDQPEFVFGATGAAALYRRSMIEDVSVEGQFFDEQFFSYREDADVAWRAQLLGWKCLYVPQAQGWHVRRVTPERRKQLPLAINFHSVKNRFLMRAKNIGGPLYRRFWFRTTVRDFQVLGYCLLVDRRLLGALVEVWRARHELTRKREIIQLRRRISDAELARWFAFTPVSEPLHPSAVRLSSVSPPSGVADRSR